MNAQNVCEVNYAFFFLGIVYWGAQRIIMIIHCNNNGCNNLIQWARKEKSESHCYAEQIVYFVFTLHFDYFVLDLNCIGILTTKKKRNEIEETSKWERAKAR